MLALGQRIYSTTCVACHGENGGGGAGPALNSLQLLTRNTDEQIAGAAAEVAGKSELDALVAYLQGLGTNRSHRR